MMLRRNRLMIWMSVCIDHEGSGMLGQKNGWDHALLGIRSFAGLQVKIQPHQVSFS